MALNKKKLIDDIIQIQKDMLEKEEQDFEDYAKKLASAIDEFVRSGEVTVNTGISVQAGNYTGVTTSKGTGTIK
ncbi:MAG: hypothetical protein Q4A09_05315 [Capnocytophaga felis]|nr:hypothetical protein [Capnocytophaga felis]